MLPVLSTKLQIPRTHPNTVSRIHLIKRLDEGLWHTTGQHFVRRLTLVAAPAGYGKTTLLCEWLGHLQVPSAWVTFDESDNNPDSFLQYLVASLQTIEPCLGKTVPAVSQSPQFTGLPLSISEVVAALVNEITAIPWPFVLVLDDYHVLEEPAIHQAVMFLLDHMPENLSLVIATRADPPLPLSRLRARRHLVEVRSEDLRFSECETAMFLRQVMHLDVQDQQVAVLTERTEGWIAGLQMAALALQGHDDIAGFVLDFSGRQRFVIDYLFDEVLRRQAEPIQAFLIQTSILDRMTGPLCDAVLGEQESGQAAHCCSSLALESGQQVLEYLDRANLFLVPLDNERRYYRYHHLWADLLRHHLRRTAPESIPRLQARAAEWFEAQGSIADAVDHWLEAGDWANAVRIVQQFGWEWVSNGRFQQLLAWRQHLPDPLIHAHPWLCIFYSWVLIFSGRTAEGEVYLSSAAKSLSSSAETADPDRRRQHGHIATLHAYLAAIRHDVVGISHHSSLALQYLPADEVSVRCIVEYFRGSGALLTDDLLLAQEAFTAAASLGCEAENRVIAINALCHLADLSRTRGQLGRALDIYRRATDVATDERGQTSPAAAEIYVGRANLYYEWNDLTTAEKDLLAAREIGKLYSNFDLSVDTTLSLSRVSLAQDDLDGAERLLQQIQQDTRQASLRPAALLLAHQMALYQAKGDLAQVSRLAAQHDWAPDTCQYAWAPAFIAYTRFLIAQRRPLQAQDLLDKCMARLQACEMQMHVIQALIVQACALDVQSKRLPAQEKLKLALSLAEPEGFIRSFVDEGEPVRSLLVSYRERLTRKSQAMDPSDTRMLTYIDKLLPAFSSLVAEKTNAPSATSLTPSALIEPLTARELEVLQLIAAGLTNSEIADRLVVTVGTVKAHSSAIYRKLDVPNRTRAVAVAREIHII